MMMYISHIVRRVGTADLPLHRGSTPAWLFERMVRLAEGIVDVMVFEFGPEGVLRRLADPFWFQSFSCVLGFDWHSSGTTTVTMAALKSAINPDRHQLAVAGGKGRYSRQTLDEIDVVCSRWGDMDLNVALCSASRLSAKVDNALIQDTYRLYHHTIIFTPEGKWAVVQQGLSDHVSYARRYHWLSDRVTSFVVEPHESIVGSRTDGVMDLTARESDECRSVSVDIVNDGLLRKELTCLEEGQKTLDDFSTSCKRLVMPRGINWYALKRAYDLQPSDYEELISIRGIGPSTVRALALVAELVYGAPPSWRDPVRFSFAVGGKDGVPYPVNRRVMDETIEVIRDGIQRANVGDGERLRALNRLRRFAP